MNLREQIADRQLGRDAGALELRDPADHRLVCGHMLSQTRRQLCLFTRDLDPAVFDQGDFLGALRELALRSRFSRIRILLQDHDRVVKRGHRIVELARRLTSSIEIRTPADDWLEHAENFMLADQYGFVHQTLSTRYAANADYHAPLTVQRLEKRFDAIWETAQADSELRRLHL